MSGAPGSGKSTVTNLLAQSIDAVVVNQVFFVESNTLFDQSGKLTYRFDWILAEDIIKQRWSVIIDCSCNFNELGIFCTLKSTTGHAGGERSELIIYPLLVQTSLLRPKGKLYQLYVQPSKAVK